MPPRTSRVWHGTPQPRRGKRRPAAPTRTAPTPTSGTAHTWRLDLGYPRPPLSLNKRIHWSQRYRLEKAVQDATCWRAIAARIPRQDHPVHVQLVWEHHPDHRQRDGDNTIATLKPAIDGLRHAGVLLSDSHQQVTILPPHIEATGRQTVAVVLHGTT